MVLEVEKSQIKVPASSTPGKRSLWFAYGSHLHACTCDLFVHLGREKALESLIVLIRAPAVGSKPPELPG